MATETKDEIDRTAAESILEAARSVKDQGSVQLVAKSIFKMGGKAEMERGAPTGRWETEPTFVMPGESFIATGDDAEQYILAGLAAMPDDFAADERAAETPQEKVERLRRELAAAEGATTNQGRAHVTAQAQETARIEDAIERGTTPKSGIDREADKARANVQTSQPTAAAAAADEPKTPAPKTPAPKTRAASKKAR